MSPHWFAGSNSSFCGATCVCCIYCSEYRGVAEHINEGTFYTLIPLSLFANRIKVHCDIQHGQLSQSSEKTLLDLHPE